MVFLIIVIPCSSTYWLLALTDPLALKTNVQELTALPTLLHKPVQIAPCPSLVFKVTDVPRLKVADPGLPDCTLVNPAGVEVMSPPPPVAVTLNVPVLETGGVVAPPPAAVPQTFATPPPPQV
jgi:hypothetical protein